MSTKKATSAAKKMISHYESNPFLVVIRGFKGIFKYNQTLMIIVMALMFVSILIGNFNTGAPIDFTSYNEARDSIQNNESMPVTMDEVDGPGVAFFIGVGFLALIVFLIFGFIGLLIATLFHTIIGGTYNYISLKSAENVTVSFEQAMSAVFSKFGTLYAVNLVTSLKIIGGYLLFIVPGIRAQLRYRMAMLPVLAKDLNYTEAIEYSKKMTNGRLVDIFGYSSVPFYISFFGGVFNIIPFIGVLLYMPFGLVANLLDFGALGVSYKQLEYLHDHKVKQPETHWINWLFLAIAILGFVILVLGILSLIALLISVTN